MSACNPLFIRHSKYLRVDYLAPGILPFFCLDAKETKNQGEAIDKPGSKVHRTFALNLNFLR